MLIPENRHDALMAVMQQAESDLKSAHAEICKLQGLNPNKFNWPEWSPQANSLRWFAAIRERFAHPHPSTNADAGGAIELPIKKPPGMYVLVPTEPTPEMLDAYDRARQATTIVANGVETYNPHQSYWALLNAAPATPSVPGNLTLATRPVAFLVPVKGGSRPLLFTDEGAAQIVAEYQQTKYRGLYVRDGSPLIATVPQLPDGWVMVPREPTAKMAEAAIASGRIGAGTSAEHLYKVMLAAAPKPQVPGGE